MKTAGVDQVLLAQHCLRQNSTSKILTAISKPISKKSCKDHHNCTSVEKNKTEHQFSNKSLLLLHCSNLNGNEEKHVYFADAYTQE